MQLLLIYFRYFAVSMRGAGK